MTSTLCILICVYLTGVIANTKARPVIINTDPGIDDSIALMLAAASPEIDVRAICVNFGSLDDIDQLAENGLRVLALAGKLDIPIYLGSAFPITAAFHDLGGPKFHGKDGLGGVNPPSKPTHSVNHSIHAAQFIVEACTTWKETPVLISLSPLTNIALALALEPKLPELCPDLYIMGGAVAAPGNVSPLSEANLANDAEAAARVFAAGFELKVASLDVTMETWLSEDYLASLEAIPNLSGPFIYEMSRFYVNAYRVYAGYDGGMPLHDPSAIMMLLHPSFYEFQAWNTSIDTSNYPNPTRGMVIADRRGGPHSPPSDQRTKFATNVNVASVLEELRERISTLP